MAVAPQTVDRAASRADPPASSIGGPTRSSWREHALACAAEQRFLSVWLRAHSDEDPELAREAVRHVDRHLDAAQQAAEGRYGSAFTRLLAKFTGADVERTMSHLDSAAITLLRLAPDSYLKGQLPSVLGSVRAHLASGDPRRERIEALAARSPDTPFAGSEREAIFAAAHAGQTAARREMMRVRSFRTVLLVSALLLTIAAAGVVALGASRPEVIPLCFNPGETVVCPTGRAAVDAPGAAGAGATAAGTAAPDDVERAVNQAVRGWDVPLVGLVGLMAAALASAAALRGVQGTSTPYSLPVALALLKLPTGVLTAILGILLMRGQFIPGLSALDTSEQIVAWAIVFGYAQQVLTRFVDQRAQSVLGGVKSSGQRADTSAARSA